MPRRRATDHPGAFHHVIVRGAARLAIFADDADRTAYCDRLSLVFPDDGAACLAWALMPNHVHLVVRTGRRPLARVMHRVGTRYSRYFNDRHGRSGHLLQGRYRAIPVATDAQLAVLVRYVHANPVRAGLLDSVEALETHRWTGHRALVGRAPAMPFHDARAALLLFSDQLTSARATLRDLMEARSDAPGETPEPSHGAERAVEPAIDDAPESPSREIERVARRVCEGQGVPVQELRGPSRRRSVALARATIAYVAFHERGIPVAETARQLGVSRQALWSRLEDGRRAAAALADRSPLDAAE